MKSLKKYSYLIVLGALISCNESVDLVTDGAKTGGLLETTTPSINYIVGEPGPYTIEYFVDQDQDNPTEKIALYKSFQITRKHKDLVEDTTDLGADTTYYVEHDTTYFSEEILLKEFDVTNTKNHFATTTATYPELIDGLAIDSGGVSTNVPANDGELTIGDKFILRTKSITRDGSERWQPYTIGMGVATRYAGSYKCLEGIYFRIHVVTSVTSDWPLETVIESVDATTYRVLEYFGVFSGNEYFFQINNGAITYPANKPDGSAQMGNALPFISCVTNPGDFTEPELHCDDTDKVINDDVNGKDRLVMTYGYLNPASGPRSFYHVLEKIVE